MCSKNSGMLLHIYRSDLIILNNLPLLHVYNKYNPNYSTNKQNEPPMAFSIWTYLFVIIYLYLYVQGILGWKKVTIILIAAKLCNLLLFPKNLFSLCDIWMRKKWIKPLEWISLLQHKNVMKYPQVIKSV